MTEKLTYESSGIDINKADKMKEGLRSTLLSSEKRVLNTVGAFSCLFDLSDYPGITHPVLCLKMEEPGSKQLLAIQHDSFASVAHDLVNHLINDTIMNGGRPLAMLDTIVCGLLEPDQVTSFIAAMADAAKKEGCALVGGETSEQPRVVPNGTYILSAACVGVVDRSRIITGETITPGDVVYAVASNGAHTNGYTLIRSLLDQKPEMKEIDVAGEPFIQSVLKPHLCYNTPLQQIFKSDTPLHGLAHITGGGVRDNSARILPSSVNASIDLSAIQVPELFSVIQREGNVPHDDMLRTFNCGVGMVYMGPKDICEDAVKIFAKHNQLAYQIGTINSGTGKVALSGQLAFA